MYKMGINKFILLAVMCQLAVCLCGIFVSCKSGKVMENNADSIQIVTEIKDVRIESVKQDHNLDFSFDSLDVWFIPFGNQSLIKEDSVVDNGMDFMRNHRVVRLSATKGNLSLGTSKSNNVCLVDSGSSHVVQTHKDSVIEEKPPNMNYKLLGIVIGIFIVVLLQMVIRFAFRK